MKAKLYFYYGAMGDAKTAQLLITNFNYKEQGMNTLLATSSIDDRDGVGVIKSRIGIEAKADLVIYEDTNFYEIVLELMKKQKIDLIIVEEAQFLSKCQVEQLSDIVDALNIVVICYGLKTDFKNKLFTGSKRLMELSDSIQEIKTMCHCGRKANCNLRLSNGEAIKTGVQIQTGGNESYIAVCRKCWKLGRVK